MKKKKTTQNNIILTRAGVFYYYYSVLFYDAEHIHIYYSSLMYRRHVSPQANVPDSVVVAQCLRNECFSKAKMKIIC